MRNRRGPSDSVPAMILAMLLSAGSAKIYKSILYEERLKKYKKQKLLLAVTRLKNRGYVKTDSSSVSATPKGKKYFDQIRLLEYIPSPFFEGSARDTIVAFDIPEKNRRKRNWLRNQLKIFGYKMLQQSLWVGPGPLPQAFYKRLEKFQIRKNVKTFRVKGKN